MKRYNKEKSLKQEFQLYKRMKEAEKAFDDAEDMMEDDYEEEGDMGCEKRKCEMGKRKPCK